MNPIALLIDAARVEAQRIRAFAPYGAAEMGRQASLADAERWDSLASGAKEELRRLMKGGDNAVH